MATRTLQVQITGDATSLNRTLRGTTGSTSKSRAAFARLGAAAKVAGAALGAGVVYELKRSVDRAEEASKVTAQTTAALKSTGHQAGVTGKQIEGLSKSMSTKIGVDRLVIQNSENMLLRFRDVRNEAGKGNKVFTRATKLSADLAAAQGIDMTWAASKLGKALNDPTKGLARLASIGGKFTEQQKKQIETLDKSGHSLQSQKLILDTLGKSYAGQAKAAASPFDKLKVQWQNLEESLGKALLPTLLKGAKALTGFLKQIQSGKGFGGDVAKTLKAIAGAASELFDALKPLGPLFKNVLLPFAGGLLKGIIGTIKLFAQVLGAVGRAAAPLAPAFKFLGTVLALFVGGGMAKGVARVGQFAGRLGFLGKAFRLLLKPIEWALAAIGKIGSKMSAVQKIAVAAAVQLSNRVASAFRTIRDVASAVWDRVKDVFKTGKDVVVGVVRAMADPIRSAVSSIGDAMRNVFSGAWSKIKDVFRTGKDAVVGFINAIIGVINKIPGVEIGKIGGGEGKTIGNTGVKSTDHKGGGKHVLSGPGYHARGGQVNRPTAIVGEEGRTHPEWVIATNPAYRKNNVAYWAQAGHDLGVPGFGLGGKIEGAAGDVVGFAGKHAGAIAGGAAGAAVGTAGGPIGITAGLILGAKGGQSVQDLIGNLPSPGSLPGWLKGLGGYIISKATDFIKDKGSVGGNIVQVGRTLQKAGFSVSEHPAFGGVTAGAHSPTSLHYSNRAIDVNRDGGPKSEPAYLAPLYNALAGTHPTELFYQNRGIPGPWPDHYDHLHLGFSEGGKINWGGLAGPSWDANELATLAHVAGMKSPGYMAQIAMGESAGDPNAVGHDAGGTQGLGLWQITTGFNDDVIARFGGRSAMFDPLKNARAAKMILDRSGTGAWYAPPTGVRGKVIGSLAKRMQAAISGKKPGSGKSGGMKVGGAKTGSKGGSKVHQGFSLGSAKTGSHGAAPMSGPASSGSVRPPGFASWTKTRKQHWLANHPQGGRDGEAGSDAADAAAEAAAALAEAIQAMIDSQNELKDEMRRSNEFATAVTSVSLREAWRAMADLISGQIAGNLQPIGGTKPAAMAGIARY